MQQLIKEYIGEIPYNISKEELLRSNLIMMNGYMCTEENNNETRAVDKYLFLFEKEMIYYCFIEKIFVNKNKNIQCSINFKIFNDIIDYIKFLENTNNDDMKILINELRIVSTQKNNYSIFDKNGIANYIISFVLNYKFSNKLK